MTGRSRPAFALSSTRHPASWWLPVAAAIAAVLIRLPFLRHGESFFVAEEAIAGLMARHLRDLPVFLWTQNYQGVPEVYLAAPVFAVFGAGVMQLKAVTLGIWAVAVLVTTRLGQRWYGSVGGAMTGALLATGSPALVYWSLSGNAEVASLTLIFALVLLVYERSVEAPERPVGAAAFAGCGVALWVHPVAIVFVATLAVLSAFRSRWWRQHGWAGVADLALGRTLHGAARIAVVALHLVVAATAATFVLTYAGVRLNAGVVTAAHPQKVLRVLKYLVVSTVALHALAGAIVPRRRALAAMGWFALGLVPIAIHAARGGRPGITAPVRHLEDVPWLVRMLVHDALPIFAGVKNMVSNRLVPWWYAAGFVAALLVYVAVTFPEWRRVSSGGAGAPSRVFAGLAAAGLLIWLGPGGMFRDVHSYRYLMPFFGLAALSAAAGVQFVWARSRRAGLLLAAACVCGFLAEDARWLLDLQWDPPTRGFLSCLEARGVHAATADGDIAYRLTFLSDERLIVDAEAYPAYRPYTEIVRAAEPKVLIRATGRGAMEPAAGQVICASGGFEAVVRPASVTKR